MEINQITHAVIGAAMEVHKALGPGLLEGEWSLGLLINFNVPVLRQGIRRIVLNLEE